LRYDTRRWLRLRNTGIRRSSSKLGRLAARGAPRATRQVVDIAQHSLDRPRRLAQRLLLHLEERRARLAGWRFALA
jgi:hypothetical protein